ncbi:MAG TPA: hypothetical protein PK939_01030 [Bacteroidales bacterium]|nr:hypothetical protein [Bacteroidales bacterium]
MKLLFWKKNSKKTGMSDGVLWQLSPLRRLTGSQPLAWNNRLGKQHNLRKHLSKLWKLNQVSLW